MIYTHKMTFDDGEVFLICNTPDGLAWKIVGTNEEGINSAETVDTYLQYLKEGDGDFTLELIEPEFEGNE